MNTINDNKRRKYNDEDDNDDVKKSSSSADDSNVEEASDESSASGGSYSTSPQATTFVAWLDKSSDKATPNNNNILSIGELHFSNAEHIAEAANGEEEYEEEKDDGSYCIVCQLKLVPNDGDEDEESDDLIYTFKDSFPFRVLKSSSCIVGLPLIPIAANGNRMKACYEGDVKSVKWFLSEEEGPFDYMMSDMTRCTLLEELEKISKPNKSPNWKVSIPNDQDVINGTLTWWTAGEKKTGWDLSKLPKEDYTTLQTIHEEEKKGPGNENCNILMSLYKDLCAFEPLVMDDNLTGDMIEDRFEWRTCLCTYFAWAVPNEAALNAIASLKQPILEIGAGTGYWAWLLTQRNVNIKAYDLADSHAGEKDRFRHSLVQDGGVEKVSCKEYAGHALMLCWPDIVGDEATTDADRGTFGVDTLQAYKGKTVVYIGELGPNVCRAAKGWGDPFPKGGSTSSEAFQEELQSNFELVKRVALPNWPPYNSHLTIWNRKET